MKCKEYSQSGTMYSINEDGTLGEKIGTCDMLINMKHKYLRELFPKRLPYPFCEKDYHDFDKRDTFNMDMTLVAWLYECLRFFQEEIKIIDLSYHKFDIDGEELTQIQCIDRMIKDCKVILLNEGPFGDQFANVDAAKDDLFKVLSKVYWAMWY